MIALASDHGGYELKQKVIGYLEANGYTCHDFGCYSLESCDYPEFGRAAAEAVAKGECEKGIVICTTGIGISIVANKVPGIRCLICSVFLVCCTLILYSGLICSCILSAGRKGKCHDTC